jgi:hypothetical protein
VNTGLVPMRKKIALLIAPVSIINIAIFVHLWQNSQIMPIANRAISMIKKTPQTPKTAKLLLRERKLTSVMGKKVVTY